MRFNAGGEQFLLLRAQRWSQSVPETELLLIEKKCEQYNHCPNWNFLGKIKFDGVLEMMTVLVSLALLVLTVQIRKRHDPHKSWKFPFCSFLSAVHLNSALG